MPRIVLVLPAFPKLSETFIVNKFLGLLRQGWDIHVVCWKSEEAEWARFAALSAPGLRERVHVAWRHSPRALVPFLLPLLLLRALAGNPSGTLRYLRLGWRRFGWRILRHFYLDAEIVLRAPDLVHFEFGSSAVDHTHLRELLGARMVASFRGHDLNFVGLTRPDYYAGVWRAVDAVHCLGEDLWQRAQRRGCPPDLPHALIGTALDPAVFTPGDRTYEACIGAPERPVRLLSVARLYWTKGHEYSLEAVRLLREAGIAVDFRIIGHGDYLPAIAFARRQLGLEDCVALLGARSPEAVREELAWADVFVHLSVSEGFCNAVMEAQAVGLPVVCSDADGLSENVAHGETGFVVPRRDAAAAARCLQALAEDAALRERMGRAGRARALEHFRLEDQMAAFDALYRRVLGLPGTAHAAPLAAEVTHAH